MASRKVSLAQDYCLNLERLVLAKGECKGMGLQQRRIVTYILNDCELTRPELGQCEIAKQFKCEKRGGG